MKGLLYKEFMLDLPSILVYGVIQALLFIERLVQAFVSAGRQDDFFLQVLILVLGSFVMYFLISMMTFTTVFSDATHAWQNFAVACPTGPAGQVASKYLMHLFCYMAVFAIHIAQFAVLSWIKGENIYFLIIMELLFFSGSIIIKSVEYPFLFLFGAERGESVKMVFIQLLIFLVAAYLLFGDVSIFREANPVALLLSYAMNLSVIFVLIGILLIAMPLFCLSMKLSIKLFPIGLENLEQ